MAWFARTLLVACLALLGPSAALRVPGGVAQRNSLGSSRDRSGHHSASSDYQGVHRAGQNGSQHSSHTGVRRGSGRGGRRGRHATLRRSSGKHSGGKHSGGKHSGGKSHSRNGTLSRGGFTRPALTLRARNESASSGPVKAAPAVATAARALGGGDSVSLAKARSPAGEAAAHAVSANATKQTTRHVTTSANQAGAAKAVAPLSAGAAADGDETLPKCGDVEEPPFLGNATHNGTANHTMSCVPEDIAFANLAGHACSINAALKFDNRTDWMSHTTVGCWRMLVFNTNSDVTSTVYQNLHDGRCVLAFSGIHGGLDGDLKLLSPPTTWEMCGGEHMWAPYVKVLRQHTALSNWSRAMHLLSGENGTCRGEPIITTQSLGGALAEIMAFCYNAGKAGDLQDPSIPNFPIQTLWTFGSPASARRPLTNVHAKDGCFKGARVFLANDPIVRYSGKAFRLKHARQHALELWPGRQPAAKGWPCNSTQAVNDGVHQKPRGKHNDLERMVSDITQHDSSSYLTGIEWLERNGEHNKALESPEEGLKAFRTSSVYMQMRANSQP